MRKRWITNILSTLILIAGIIYLYNKKDSFSALQNLNIVTFLLLVVYGIFAYFFVALSFKYSIKLFNISLKFKEWFGLSVVNTMYNYFVPARGGLIARALYLKNNYAFEYSKYASLLGGSFLLSFLVSSFTALMLLITVNLVYERFFLELFLISLILFVGTLAIIIIFWHFPNLYIKTGWKRFDNFLINIIKGFKYFKSNHKLLGLISLTQFGLIFFLGLRLYFAFLAINIQVNILYVFIVQALIVFSMVISLTPGNLGIKEGIIGLLATMMNIPLSDAILAATIDRVVSMVVVFSFGGIYHFVLMRETKLKKAD